MIMINLFLHSYFDLSLSKVVPMCLIHCNCAIYYSASGPMAIVNFLIAQGDILGESNLPRRNNKVTSIFFMSAQWDYILALNFSLIRLLVFGEYLFFNWLNLYLQGIEIFLSPMIVLKTFTCPKSQ